MGVIYINLDIFDKALANYQKAREIRESVENPDLEQIAYSYHNIGTVYQRQKKYADAITWHKKALEIRQEIYPDNEPIIAASLTMIGNDYTQAAKNDSSYHFNDAFEYFAKGLEIRKLTLGETHPDTAWSYQSIGLWHFYQGEYEEAIENYLKCLSIRENDPSAFARLHCRNLILVRRSIFKDQPNPLCKRTPSARRKNFRQAFIK